MAGFLGFFRFSIFGFYVYAFWIAAIFLKNGRINPGKNVPYSAGDMLATIMSLLIGMTMIFTLTPNF